MSHANQCTETVPTIITQEMYDLCYGSAEGDGYGASRAIEGAISRALQQSGGRGVVVLPVGVPLSSVTLAPTGPTMLGGCDCYFKAPTIPVYRSRMTHLDDCPARDSGHPVGVLAGNGR